MVSQIALVAGILLLTLGVGACSKKGGGDAARAIGQSSATATPPPVPLTRYVNPAYPYELAYPDGWRPVTANPDAVHFDGSSGRRISVEVQPVPQRTPAFTLPVYADAQVETFRKTVPNLVELQRTRIGLPNKGAGIEVDVTWGESNAQHRALLLYVLDASVAFLVRAEAPPSAFPAERRVLDASLRSFTLTPPD